MSKFFLFFSLFLFLGSSLSAQGKLEEDLGFFRKKSVLYQHWLTTKGMGDVLAVDTLQMQKNGTELRLFLTLRTHDPDTAAAMWQALETGFARQNDDEKIGPALFETFVRMMEIEPEKGSVEIYLPKQSGSGYHHCFYIWFWEEGGKVATESRVNECRSQPITMKVRPPEIKRVSEGVRTRVVGREAADKVFDQILAYARQRFENKSCDNRFPSVEEMERSNYRLVFSVSDLCREVLVDEKPSFLCRLSKDWFGIDCNDMRRERLTFAINFIPTEEGYLLNGQLTGKFGSGVYRPRKSNYLDMEPDYEDYLVDYARKFQRKLQDHLER